MTDNNNVTTRTRDDIWRDQQIIRNWFIQAMSRIYPDRFGFVFRKQRACRRLRQLEQIRQTFQRRMNELNSELAEITGELVIDTKQGVLHLPEDSPQFCVLYETDFGQTGAKHD